jgi:hypothetical protein
MHLHLRAMRRIRMLTALLIRMPTLTRTRMCMAIRTTTAAGDKCVFSGSPRIHAGGALAMVSRNPRAKAQLCLGLYGTTEVVSSRKANTARLRLCRDTRPSIVSVERIVFGRCPCVQPASGPGRQSHNRKESPKGTAETTSLRFRKCIADSIYGDPAILDCCAERARSLQFALKGRC